MSINSNENTVVKGIVEILESDKKQTIKALSEKTGRSKQSITKIVIKNEKIFTYYRHKGNNNIYVVLKQDYYLYIDIGAVTENIEQTTQKDPNQQKSKPFYVIIKNKIRAWWRYLIKKFINLFMDKIIERVIDIPLLKFCWEFLLNCLFSK